MPTIRVHLVDGTYELFRQHFGQVSRHSNSHPLAAAAGVVASTLALVADGASHVGVASDHTIESFRNDLYAGYKDGAEMDEAILLQIPVMEDALAAAGFTVWPMVSHEADDALGAAAAVADADERVEQVLIVTPDKDLGQCVRGDRVVQFDRRKREILDEDGDHREVRDRTRFDPRLPRPRRRLGRRIPGSARVGCQERVGGPRAYGHIEDIPPAAGQWDVTGLRGAAKLSATLQAQLSDAYLFRRIATIDVEIEVGAVDDWRWTGPTDRFVDVAEQLGSPELVDQARTLATAIS